VSVSPRWSYVQARLQARHGDRLPDADWRVLEATRSLDQFIERARGTSLRRFGERVNAGMSSHAIERSLRAAWRDYVAEVSSWAPAEWQPAILWTAHLPDLPVIDALLRGATPAWAQQDPVLIVFLESERRALDRSPLAALLPARDRPVTLAGRWFAHWRALWPRGSNQAPLMKLAELVEAHVARLARAGPQDASASYRRELAHSVARMFRRHGGAPIAVFCHLALVALDLDRLRGGLARRRLFEPARAQEAA
jgi:hypothetical protein